MSRRGLTASAILAVFLAGAAPGARAADLTIGQAAPPTSVDPHFYNAAPNNGLAMHLFDRLTERMPDARLRPGLAQSWRLVDDTTWEFKLRPGVTFTDGQALTPDDVAFSYARVPNVPNSPGNFASMVRPITRIEIMDAQTLRLHSAQPAPNMPGDLAAVAIVSRHVGEHAATEDYNAGRAAIGTGPYKLVRYLPGDRVELARNEAWWGQKPDWDRVTIRIISNPGARTAALRAGDVDIIDFPSPPDLAGLRADPALSIVSVTGARVIYLSPDFSHQGAWRDITDADGKPLETNPLLDRRVREALSVAINRQAIAERIMLNTAIPTGQWLTPTMFGYAPDVKPPEYDPARARKLLADAGYPQGFKLTLHTPNDRYPSDAQTAQAVAQMWTRIGVQTAVEALPWSAYSVRSNHQEFSMGLLGWGSNTAEAGYTLINVLGTFDPALGRGSSNNGRYSNPTLDTLTAKALATTDDAAREAMERQAVAMAMEDVGFIPLHQLVNSWATKKAIRYEPRVDERTLAMDAHPAR